VYLVLKVVNIKIHKKKDGNRLDIQHKKFINNNLKDKKIVFVKNGFLSLTG